MKCYILLSTIVLLVLATQPSEAHQSGCHRWHSCPSDRGTYICGDTGHCSRCPDNQYCQNGSSIITATSVPSQIPTTTAISTPTPLIECRGTFQGTVERIIDGDTLVIVGCSDHIRLSLVDTPKSYESGYREAKSFVERLCDVGSTVTIDQDDRQPYDKYGRIIAVIYCQNKNLNAELLYSDLGVIDTRFCSKSEFRNLDWAKDYGCDIKQTSSTTSTPIPTPIATSTIIPTTTPTLTPTTIPATVVTSTISSELSKTGQVTKNTPSPKGFLESFAAFIVSLFAFF